MKGIQILAKVTACRPHMAYTGLRMSLKLEAQYLQINVLTFCALVESIERAIREKFLPALFECE